MRRILFILCTLIACSPRLLSAQSFSRARLDSLLSRIDERQKAMGSLAISEKGKITYTRAIGNRSYKGGKGIAADPDTRYRIGSITKMFTAVMIFQLVEENKLSLDTRLSQFFPTVPNAKDITVGMMLSHRSGIRNITADSSYMSWYLQPKSREELLGIITGGPAAFRPDGDVAYSNTNYILLGFIISDLTGKTYAEALKSRITDRIGLKETAVSGKIRTDRNEAASYSMTNGRWEPDGETDASIPGAAGAISATPADLTRFINALFAGKLIGAASLKQMTTLYGKGGVIAEKGYGMGIHRFPFGEKRAWGHNGGIDGFISSLCYFPEDSVAVALCLNGSDYNTNQLMIGILSIVFNRPYDIPQFRDVKLTGEVLDRYVGTYAGKDFPLKLTISREGDKLMGQATGQGAFPLTPLSETEFEFAPANLKITFSKSGAGSFDQLLLKQVREFLLTKQ